MTAKGIVMSLMALGCVQRRRIEMVHATLRCALLEADLLAEPVVSAYLCQAIDALETQYGFLEQHSYHERVSLDWIS